MIPYYLLGIALGITPVILWHIWKRYRYPIKCAWCGCTVGRTSVKGSHGQCQPCQDKWLDDWRKGIKE
jgi:hypothetical protein